jgi:hypothetical protein
MRLGLLGPAGGDVGALGKAAEFLLNGARVHRAIYLGVDGALDRAVAAWAQKLVGDDPSDDAAWTRAAEVAVTGSAADIDRFVSSERARLRLKSLEALPDIARTVEMVGDRVAVLIYDKAMLDEEDIVAANLLFFGKSDEPLVRKIGARWFVTPGPIGCPGGGVAVIDDDRDEIALRVYDSTGKPSQREVLAVHRAAKARVPGEP